LEKPSKKTTMRSPDVTLQSKTNNNAEKLIDIVDDTIEIFEQTGSHNKTSNTRISESSDETRIIADKSAKPHRDTPISNENVTSNKKLKHNKIIPDDKNTSNNKPQIKASRYTSKSSKKTIVPSQSHNKSSKTNPDDKNTSNNKSELVTKHQMKALRYTSKSSKKTIVKKQSHNKSSKTNKVNKVNK
jgi:hypothetical protein